MWPTKLVLSALPLVALLPPHPPAALAPEPPSRDGTTDAAVRAAAHAADPPAEEVEALRQLSGCFEVTYRFAEDGEHDLFSPEYGLEDPVTEWIGFERADDGRFVLIHVGIRQGRAAPHFHEVWRYEEADDRWRHEVWNSTPDDPDRQLRYACESEWEGNRWHCAAGRAGKPFRDSGAPFGFDRDDYDWLDRTNTLLVTPRGWIHDEHNRKMTDDGELVARELGWITYDRIEDDACGAAPRRFPN